MREGTEAKKKKKRKKKLDDIPSFYQVTFANMAADHGHFKWENVRARQLDRKEMEEQLKS